jgi:hypothetical protein
MGGSADLDPDVLVDSLVTDVIDGLRADLHPQFGVRPYRLYTVKRTWTGQIVGEGRATDVTTEITPQPRVLEWSGYKWVEAAAGLTTEGEYKITEISLSYTYDEITGGSLGNSVQWLLKLTEALGQGNPDRYMVPSRPPFVDREQDMGWVVHVRAANAPGCGR